MKQLVILAMSICGSCNFMITSMSVSNNHGPKPAAHLRLQEHRLKDIANWLEGAYCHATREYPDNTSLLIILKQLQEEYAGQGLKDFLKDHGQSKALINATKIVDAVNKDPRVILSKSLISKNPCIYKKTFQQILFDLITRTTELKFPLRECDTMVVYHDLPDDLLARNQHLTSPDTLVTYLVAKHLLEQDSDCEQL